MASHSEQKRDFPMRLSLKGRTVVLRPMTPGDRERLVAFARTLPEDDLLFLQRDITQPAEVDAWIREASEGSLVTLVAWEGDEIVGYATFDRGSVRWTRHVAELRVVVAQSARGIGIGRLLLELAFEMVLEVGVTKVIARMTTDQTGALSLFKRLGFEEEAVLRDHALGANGLTHDLLVLSFHPRMHQEQLCEYCGVPVLEALSVDGSRLCSHCYEDRYQELGGGG
jgi:L-amino acid N-acyltransferase YncA